MNALRLSLLSLLLSAPAAAGADWSPVETPTGTGAVGAAALDGRLVLVGGDTVDSFAGIRIQDGGAFAPGSHLPMGVADPATVVLDGQFFTFGGFSLDGTSAVDAVQVFDPVNDFWRVSATLDTPRGDVSAAAVGGQIHVLGGRFSRDGPSMTLHEVFDPATGAFSAAAPLPAESVAAAGLGENLFALGRSSDGAATLFRYDPGRDAWQGLTEFTGGVRSLTGVGGRLLVGGPDSVQVLDPATGRVVDRLPLPSGMSAGVLVADSDRLFVGDLADDEKDVDTDPGRWVMDHYPDHDSGDDDSDDSDDTGDSDDSDTGGSPYQGGDGGGGGYGASGPWFLALFGLITLLRRR